MTASTTSEPSRRHSPIAWADAPGGPRHPPVPSDRFGPDLRHRPPRSRVAVMIESRGRSYVSKWGIPRRGNVRASITRLLPNSPFGFLAPITRGQRSRLRESARSNPIDLEMRRRRASRLRRSRFLSVALRALNAVPGEAGVNPPPPAS
jgi:hypothetical protein